MANDTKKYGKRYKIKGANAMRFTAHSPNIATNFSKNIQYKKSSLSDTGTQMDKLMYIY